MVKVVFVVGPTASGKSALALDWSQRLGGAILNCDSVQVFKSLDIGSAKPSSAEFATVPHYLFDYVDEGKTITAGEYQRDFYATLEKIQNQFPIVFVVGGTGFYFQAIEKGMYTIGAADPEVQKALEKKLQEPGGAIELHSELLERDPVTAAKISVNDHYRLVRAVEMMRTHGKPPSQIKQEFEMSRSPFPYPLLKIGVRSSREWLLDRVKKRADQMLEAGLLEEVKGLLQRNPPSWQPLLSIGYKECVDFLSGKVESERALKDLIVQNTMKLAKKQRTWFQRDPDILWISPDDESAAWEQLQIFFQK